MKATGAHSAGGRARSHAVGWFPRLAGPPASSLSRQSMLLFLLILAVPLAEFLCTWFLARQIGWFRLFLVLLSGFFVGLFLLARQGLRGIRPFPKAGPGKSLNASLLGRAIVDMVATSSAGILFAFPGVLSDLLAICLLIPGLRGLIVLGVFRRLKSKINLTVLPTEITGWQDRWPPSSPGGEIIDEAPSSLPHRPK